MKSLFIISYILLGILTLYQGSKFVDSVIGGKIARVPTDININQKTEPDKTESSVIDRGYDSYISLVPLFQPAVNSKEETITNTSEGITDSPLLKQYQVTGIIYLGGSKSIALIKKSGDRESKIYHVNDTLGQATIVRIKPDKVYLSDRGNIVILPIYYRNQNNSTPARVADNRNYSTSGSYQPSKRIKKILSRSEVENKVFKKVNQILTQIAVSPYMKNGRMEGLRLVRVPRNNIVYELGGRSGDIIKRVNGHELSQIDQMYKLWDNIKDDSVISVDLERNHQIYSYTFEIRE